MNNFHVVICTPSTGHCRTTFAFSLARLSVYAATTKVWPELKHWTLDYQMIESSGISHNRESLVDQALAKPEMTHLLFIDEDMGFSFDVLHRLAAWRQPIVACNYRTRIPPATFTAMRADKTGRIETTQKSSGLEPATFTGFGFCLLERQVLEAVKTPRFNVFWDYDVKHYSTEDAPFFLKAAEQGFTCFVDHDASKRIWHCGEINYVWDEDYTKHVAGIASNEDLGTKPPNEKASA